MVSSGFHSFSSGRLDVQTHGLKQASSLSDGDADNDVQYNERDDAIALS
jgi:hypothetical protein